MLQVKDMEFQLVIPNFAHVQSSRPSEDSGVLTKDVDVRQDGNGFLRTESPVSMLSGGSKHSPMSELPAVSSWSSLSAPPRLLVSPRNQSLPWRPIVVAKLNGCLSCPLALPPKRGRPKKLGSLSRRVFLPLYDTWYGRI